MMQKNDTENGTTSTRMVLFNLAVYEFKLLIPIYSTLVRPHLEYAIQASSPYLKKDIDHLECLQRLATRMVKGCWGLFYEERLGTLSLFSLARRRLRGD